MDIRWNRLPCAILCTLFMFLFYVDKPRSTLWLTLQLATLAVEFSI